MAADSDAGLPSAYDPPPVDDAATLLPPELLAVVDLVAERVHDVWARKRLDEGWHYGPKRSDERQEHPCLIPFAELPEFEREYDRATARTALRGLLDAGYRVVREPRNTG